MGKKAAQSQITAPEDGSDAQVGLGIRSAESETVVIGTAVRAHAHGFDVFIPATAVGPGSRESLRDLGVTAVDVDASAEQDRLREAHADAARAAGCAGIVIAEAGTAIDYEASWRRSQDTAAFDVDAVEGTALETDRLVGIPAYNESVGIGSTVLAVREYADEVVVIDDGSDDATVEIVEQTEATLLEHGENQGKGQALRTFFEYARASDHESFVVLDGDGQHLPDDIPAVVEPIEAGEADLVVGSRYLEDGQGEETPFHRRVGQRVLDYLTFGSSGTKLSDTQSGFRAFSPDALETLSIQTDGMGVESEMIASAQHSALRIEERQIDVRYDGIDGQTFNPVRHGLGVAGFLVRSIRDRHPLVFYGVPGVAVAGVGVALGLNAVGGQGTVVPEQLAMGVLLATVGFLSVFCGLLLNRIPDMIQTTLEGGR